MKESIGSFAENRLISLKINQALSDTKLVVQGKEDKQTEIAIASLTSDVDKNIPINSLRNPNRIALIIGNENYSERLGTGVNVPYARNDAAIFKEYALSLMGVEGRNAYLLLDATAGEMRMELFRVTELVKRLGAGSELVFYYAGHGLPEEGSGTPYLIPTDVDATNLSSVLRVNRKSQDPEIRSSDQAASSWESWTLK